VANFVTHYGLLLQIWLCAIGHKGGFGHTLWATVALEQTARYWVGQGKQERYMWRRGGKRFSLTLERGHDGRIREVPHEDGRSSMYKVYDCIIVPGENFHELSAIYRPCLIMWPMIIYVCTSRFFTILIGVYFSAG
jgi:hypothetical protein